MFADTRHPVFHYQSLNKASKVNILFTSFVIFKVLRKIWLIIFVTYLMVLRRLKVWLYPATTDDLGTLLELFPAVLQNHLILITLSRNPKISSIKPTMKCFGSGDPYDYWNSWILIPNKTVVIQSLVISSYHRSCIGYVFCTL